MEKRFLSATCPGLELRFAAGADTKIDISAAEAVTGYAAKFNVRSMVMRDKNDRAFVEVVEPGAFDDVLGDDVIALFNHDPSQPLARSRAGTLRLSVDEVGLKYDFDLALDETSQRVAAYISDGRVNQSSFSFIVADGGDRWEKQGDGIILRSISKIRALLDVSPVTYPAYSEASVALRSQTFAEITLAADAAVAADRETRNAARRRELELLALR